MIGRTNFDLFPEEIARKHQADVQKLIATDEVLDTVKSHRISGGDGQLRNGQILNSPVFDSSLSVVGFQSEELISCSIDGTLVSPSAGNRPQMNCEKYEDDPEGGSMFGKCVEIPAQHKDG